MIEVLQSTSEADAAQLLARMPDRVNKYDMLALSLVIFV